MNAPLKSSKQQLVLGLLSAANGASISELMAATNWLPHSTRAVLSRLRKQGYIFERQQAADSTRYKLLAALSIEVRA
jgi:DNA-binding MarR family transcriptional regulator